MNTCVCCGEPIPEGRQVCKKCEAESYVGEDQVFVNQQRKTPEETARDTRYHVRWPGTMAANETIRSNEMNENPCWGCPRRKIGCHGSCPDYAVLVENNRIKNQEKLDRYHGLGTTSKEFEQRIKNAGARRRSKKSHDKS